MVAVITFLTFTNIALGYGLAVYMNRQFGTLTFSRMKAVSEKVETPGQPAAAKVEAQPAAVVKTEAPIAPAPQPAEINASAAPAVEQLQSDTVDEENVLAGIEEFRSQLAKIADSTEASPAAPELVAAAN